MEPAGLQNRPSDLLPIASFWFIDSRFLLADGTGCRSLEAPV
jgi:hypothetical protein